MGVRGRELEEKREEKLWLVRKIKEKMLIKIFFNCHSGSTS